MGGEEEGEVEKKKRVVVESMGWLTESTIMPKKHRAIAGVGPSSIVELKAQLYKSQEESKRSSNKESHHLGGDHLQVHRAKHKITAHDPFSAKNSGVESRNIKDKLELKAINDGSVSYAALEKKAELYDKLARGELPDEEDKEKYCVDFFSKTLVQDGPQGCDTSSATEPAEYEDDAFMLPNSKPMGLGQAAGTVDNDEHKRFIREVHEEVNQAREKASDLKAHRQEQATARREKLRQAYLRKKLEKLKAASAQTEQT